MRHTSSSSVRVFWPPYSRAELIDLLRERVGTLHGELPLRQAVLFGSWAQGRATAFSDIDLLVVYSGPPRDDAYALTHRVVALKGLEVHIYAEDEAKQVAPVLARWARDGVDLLQRSPGGDLTSDVS